MRALPAGRAPRRGARLHSLCIACWGSRCSRCASSRRTRCPRASCQSRGRARRRATSPLTRTRASSDAPRCQSGAGVLRVPRPRGDARQRGRGAGVARHRPRAWRHQAGRERQRRPQSLGAGRGGRAGARRLEENPREAGRGGRHENSPCSRCGRTDGSTTPRSSSETTWRSRRWIAPSCSSGARRGYTSAGTTCGRPS